MSKFHERIRILNDARDAETAMAWFAFVESQPKAAAITTTAQVIASATNEGKAAQHYVAAAVKQFHVEIIARAKVLAEEDLKRGEELLK